MHFINTIFAVTMAIGFVSARQINFYSDRNCQNYIGEAHPDYAKITGGPAGGFSALWVNGDPWSCTQSCGPYWICGDSGCNNKVSAAAGKCVSFSTGVWGVNKCEFC